jgi:hypothetical protein
LVPDISPFDLGKIRVLDQEEQKCKELHERMLEMNEHFNRSLRRLIIPLRFSILAILSARKCTVFDDSLIKFMDYVLDLAYENDKIYCLRYPGDQEETSSLADESSI